jgi:hypothetical protein
VLRCEQQKLPSNEVLQVYGAESGRLYCAVIWKSDVVKDCARIAYGAKVISFVRTHTCRPVHRVVATLYVRNFVVNLSSVSTRVPGATSKIQFGNAFKFSQLARSRETGGLKDLLRDGTVIPGPHGRPPADAEYHVDLFNDGIDLFYAWYVKRPPNQGSWNSLRLIGTDLGFTELTG